MLRQSIFLLAAVAGLTAAQDSTITGAATTATESTSPSSTNPSNTTNAPLTHTVAVALGGHTFVPDVTLAEVGDTIEFQFYPTNHSVIRAEYGYPCIPYEDTGVDKVGFFSGFKPVDAILPDPPSWSITVNNTDPVFFYCGAPGSCINYQMVGVINPNATTSLQVQKQKAKDSTYMLVPGQPTPDEAGNSYPASSSTSSTAGTHSTTSAPAAATTSASASSSSHHSGLSTGAIAGIAIGAAAVALAAAVLLYLCGRQSRQGRHQQMPQQVPFQPGHGHMSYIDPHKHMSMHSSGVGPALPGYAPSEHHSMPSPPLVAYAPSDALNPGHPSISPSASPHHDPAVPAYSNSMYVQDLSSLPHLQPVAALELDSASPNRRELPALPFYSASLEPDATPVRRESPGLYSHPFMPELDSASERKEPPALPENEQPRVELPSHPLTGFNFATDAASRPVSELPSLPIGVEPITDPARSLVPTMSTRQEQDVLHSLIAPNTTSTPSQRPISSLSAVSPHSAQSFRDFQLQHQSSPAIGSSP